MRVVLRVLLVVEIGPRHSLGEVTGVAEELLAMLEYSASLRCDKDVRQREPDRD